MKLINSEDNKKTFQLKKDNYNIDFTLIDMGSFVGHRYRSAFASTPHYWETMFVDIKNQNDKSKNINSNFLISDSGHLLRFMMVDGNKNKRVRLFYPNDYMLSKDDVAILRGNGISKVDGVWVQDYICKDDDIFSPSYYYDEATQQFIDNNGKVYPEKTPIANYNLAQMITQAAQQTSKNYNQKILNINSVETPEDIDDISF